MEEASKASRGKAQVRELTPAEAEKESGNDAFKKGEYEKVSLSISAPTPSQHRRLVPCRASACCHIWCTCGVRNLQSPQSPMQSADHEH